MGNRCKFNKLKYNKNNTQNNSNEKVPDHPAEPEVRGLGPMSSVLPEGVRVQAPQACSQRELPATENIIDTQNYDKYKCRGRYRQWWGGRAAVPGPADTDNGVQGRDRGE